MRFSWILFFFSAGLCAQNISYVMQVSKILSSKEYAGRGYNHLPGEKVNGADKAAKFIGKEIKNIGAYDLEKYIQKSNHFKSKINFQKIKFKSEKKDNAIEFTNNVIDLISLKINGKELILGKDYLPSASVPSAEFSGSLIKVDSVHYINKEKKIIIQLENKLMFSASTQQDDFVLIHIDKRVVSNEQNTLFADLKIKSQLKKVKSQNIYCFIPGTEYPDSFVVFSAHYDHLGNIDTVYFPGANDNASGVAVLLDLIQYFQKHPSKYSVAFFFFTGEEIGLIGSEHYVKHPLFDLKRIKFLINLDLMGGGSEGIMVVNGRIFQKEFEILENINESNHLNLKIKSRGKAQNSDHYWFTENGVKSFFIYTMGDITAYHDTNDKADNLKFTNYENWFKLILHIINHI